VAVASETETEPANAPPFGLIVGVLTIFFESFPMIVELVGDRLVTFEIGLVVAVTVVEFVEAVVLVTVLDD
jgi:hypothetical protein